MYLVNDKILDELKTFFFFNFSAENAIENMIGPDWKKRWLYWKNRTQEQVKNKSLVLRYDFGSFNSRVKIELVYASRPILRILNVLY